jgi:hypothetical protein
MSAEGRRTLLGIVALAAITALAAAYPAMTGQGVGARWEPTWAHWLPRVTGWTPVVVVVAVALFASAPLAGRLGWRWLLLTAWGASWVWTMALALVDGHAGIATGFTHRSEYLIDARSIESVSRTFAEFVSRIPLEAPDNWSAHVAGHPIGALLLFAGLVRLGFDDPFSLGLLVLTLGTTAITAGDGDGARRRGRRAGPGRDTLPRLGPAAIFVGVSADGLYMAITAWGLAALAVAATSSTRRSVPLGVLAGLLLGVGVYLSYGLPLMGLVALAVLAGARSWRPLPWAWAEHWPWPAPSPSPASPGGRLTRCCASGTTPASPPDARTRTGSGRTSGRGRSARASGRVPAWRTGCAGCAHEATTPPAPCCSWALPASAACCSPRCPE